MKRSTLGNERGFTLIEIMVVVIILGVLAGLVVPKLLDEPDKARRVKAQTQIQSLGEALGMFKLDNGFFPSTDQGLEALVSKPDVGRTPKKYREGGYIRKAPSDPWESPYVYISPGAHDDYDLISYGADGEPGGEGKNADIESWDLE